jgi:hypothetical protein
MDFFLDIITLTHCTHEHLVMLLHAFSQYHVVIIGIGILGKSIFLHLAARQFEAKIVCGAKAELNNGSMCCSDLTLHSAIIVKSVDSMGNRFLYSCSSI